MSFTPFSGSTRLETAALPPTGCYGSPVLALTRGLAAIVSADSSADSGSPAALAVSAAQLTLPDGRLNVGTHLPLMAGRYRYLSTLGEGVSAQVVLAEDILAARPSALVAIKVMRRQHALAGQREARALRFLHAAAPGGAAPGLARLLGAFQLGAHYCLVTERLFPWLLDWIADSSQLPPQQALAQLRKMAHQLLLSTAFLHSRGVVHADIKPDNLLFCNPPGSGSVAMRLVDFGAAFSVTATDTAAVGFEAQTLPYRAPEAALGLPIGAAIDLWSVGVVLAEMALKRALLPCGSPLDLLRQMAALLGPLPPHMLLASPLAAQLGSAASAPAAMAAQVALPPELQARVSAEGRPPLRAAPPWGGCQLSADLAAVDASLADLLMRLLAYDPLIRLTAQQALLHPFFDALCPIRATFPALAAQQGQQPVVRPQVAAVAAAVRRVEPAESRPGKAEPRKAGPAPLPPDPGALPPPDGLRSGAAAAEQWKAQPAAAEAAEPRQRGRASALPSASSISHATADASHAAAQPAGQPWRAAAVPPARRPPPHPSLPAAQLAVRRWEEQQLRVTADPYSGSFGVEATPPKSEPVAAAAAAAAAAVAAPLEAQLGSAAPQQRQQDAPASTQPAHQAGGRQQEQQGRALEALMDAAAAAAGEEEQRRQRRPADGTRKVSGKAAGTPRAAAGKAAAPPQQQHPLPSVAGSSGAAPAGLTPAKAQRLAGRQLCAPRQEQADEGALFEEASPGLPGTSKRRQRAAAAADAGGGSQAAAGSAVKRPRRSQQQKQGEQKKAWWVVQG